MLYYNRDPKRDHNFDNHPHAGAGSFGTAAAQGFGAEAVGWRVEGSALESVSALAIDPGT